MHPATSLMALLFLVLVSFSLTIQSADASRHLRHHKRAVTDEYEYRDTQEYTDNGGIFIDSVPMRTTTDLKDLRSHQKTNRFPKLRKFFAEVDRFYH